MRSRARCAASGWWARSAPGVRLRAMSGRYLDEVGPSIGTYRMGLLVRSVVYFVCFGVFVVCSLIVVPRAAADDYPTAFIDRPLALDASVMQPSFGASFT